ncbi:uncharacterized protein LOC126317462 [Schistocerca gregaria]|uniref:uncharacterized protein LOC126317462 n=1 Tax=Schistocerca gregaria TaxID=7010 RepID=UPI00211DE5FF|nr:uncharacterized protein LOC126317462 [Schistocerca gregaria]
MDPFFSAPCPSVRASGSDDARLGSKIATSVQHIEKALATWPLSDSGIAFNGGKDSIVLLALVQYVLSHRRTETSSGGRADDPDARCAPEGNFIVDSEFSWSSLALSPARRGSSDSVRTIFFLDQNNFPEVLEFMWDVAMKNKLDVVIIRKHIKTGLRCLNSRPREEYGSCLVRPLKVVFMGTRRSDPGGTNLSTFSRTDEGWPDIIRVNPLLDWDYHDIWNFTMRAELPYCSLYSKGYTSIGSVETTRPNKHLWQEKMQRYLPAWCLSSGALERSGRTAKPAQEAAPFL